MRPLSNLHTRSSPIRATIGTKDERVISLNRSVLSPHVPRLCAWVELWLAPTVRGALAGPGGAGRITIEKNFFFLRLSVAPASWFPTQKMNAPAQITTLLSQVKNR